ncbi:hypothetical protein BRD19_09820 [Halobacteriales archaeon SW_7_65_23]|nr:MAG: hypothetical protein BRD19_09820 [Halobacteriales archaeon SW_7_65_23]
MEVLSYLYTGLRVLVVTCSYTYISRSAERHPVVNYVQAERMGTILVIVRSYASTGEVTKHFLWIDRTGDILAVITDGILTVILQRKASYRLLKSGRNSHRTLMINIIHPVRPWILT